MRCGRKIKSIFAEYKADNIGNGKGAYPNAPTPVVMSKMETFLSAMNFSMLLWRCDKAWSPSIR